MSQQPKRNAKEAFGFDGNHQSSDSPNKKHKQKRSKRPSRGNATAAANGTDSSLAPPQSEAQLPDSNISSSDVSVSVRKQRQSSNPVLDDSQNGRIASQNAADLDGEKTEKKRKRSKRQSKPHFDENHSHIELVLANATDLETTTGVAATQGPLTSQGQLQQPISSKRRRSDKHNSRRSKSENQWTLTQPWGGAFIDHDPILTPDQQTLLLATKHDILVYATKTSLLVRSIHIDTNAVITAYSLISGQDSLVAVGLSDGSLIRYDYASGKELSSTQFAGAVTALMSTSSENDHDGFLMINHNEENTYHMTSLLLNRRGKKSARRSLLTQKTLIKPQICFSATLGIVVVCSKRTILVGTLGEGTDSAAPSIRWQEIAVSGGRVVCFDAKFSSSKHNKKPKPIVNVAVGLQSGEIHIYNDVLNAAIQSRGNDLQIQRLHWHRSAPRAVKFSPDMNYLISGGDETVLIIWQLDTNQKQVLPHLTASILNVSIATNGSAYSIRLGDNSVMVLSTADLQPFANVSSLAIDASSKAFFVSANAPPAQLHPYHQDRLLLAYSLQGLNPNLRPSEKSSNMLQTYDTSSHLQLSRQALARNLTSSVNIGPQGQPIIEPDVTHLDITHDGNWLVTVDQWRPADGSLKELYLGRGEQAGRELLNECFLRFWSTSQSASDSGADVWQMNTRIDEPISLDLSSTRKEVLAIGVNPEKAQVAVADSTRTVKIYSPKARMRSGVPVKDADGHQLFTWTCDHALSLQETSTTLNPAFACLAFSEDGSVLAVAWGTDSHLKARTHLIELSTCSVAASLPDVVSHGHAQLAFSGRFLLGLSETFCIYDTVKMERTLCVEIEKRFEHAKSRMAVNHRTGVAAIAMSERAVSSPSQVVLFDIGLGQAKRPLSEVSVPDHVHILLADRHQSGFLIIDGGGRTMKLSPPSSEDSLAVRPVESPEKAAPRTSLEEVFGSQRKRELPLVEQSVQSGERRAIEDVFRFETTAEVPTPKDLFSQVATVIAGAA